MITIALLTGQGQATHRLKALLSQQAALIEVAAESEYEDLLAGVPVDAVMMEVEHLTEPLAAAFRHLQGIYPDSTAVCVTGEEVAERARIDKTLAPEYWVIVGESEAQTRAQLDPIMELISARSLLTPLASPTLPSRERAVLTTGGDQALSRPESALYRMMARMYGSSDTQHLLSVYCEAVQELTQCVSHSLLWREPREREFTCIRSAGLPIVLQDIFRLEAKTPLTTWLQRHRGLVARDVLRDHPEGTPVLRQMELFGGVLAVPLFCQMVLRGVMVIGPKVVGEPYSVREAETLFSLSTTAAMAVAQGETRRELESRNHYIDQVLSTMESGVVTLDLEGRVRVCNPYAARVLGLDWAHAVGRDLRVLPAPLADYLFACTRQGEELTRQEVTVLGGRSVLSVSTRRMMDAGGRVMGGLLLVEDITSARALAEERRRAERNDVISQILARFAHELKNPLATIHTFAELVPSRLGDPEFQQYWTSHVKQDVRRLDELIAKLLSLAEPPESVRSAVHVGELLRLAVERVAQVDEPAAGCIDQHVPPLLPLLQVDADLMSAALAHILRFQLGPGHNPVTVEARLGEGPHGEQPVEILAHAKNLLNPRVSPQELFDPSFVLNHPDIDLGPSASQRLVESQGGVLEAYYEESDIVFRLSLLPMPGVTTDAVVKE